MFVVVAAAAVADTSAADAWLLMLCLQAAGVGVFAKCQVPCTQHILHCATPPTATTTSAATSLDALGSARPWAPP